MHPAKANVCKSRDMLKARLRADLRVYRDAVVALQESTGPDFREAHHKAEHARLAYEAARDRFNAHVASHGCIDVL